MPYQYRMVQIPPNIVVKEDMGDQAASYLQRIVNQRAKQGWEFYRVDSLGVRENPGCIASLFGAPARTLIYYIVTFRREVPAKSLQSR